MNQHSSEAAHPSPHMDEEALRGSLRFGDCELIVPTRELLRKGERQPIRKRVYDLITFLISRRPGTVTHTEIGRAVWGRLDVRPTAIAQAVLQARRATGDDLEHPTLFVSVHGVGYRFGGTLRAGTDQPNQVEGPSAATEIRALIEEAQTAARRDDPATALFHAEKAIALAQRMGSNTLASRAMTIAAGAALIVGTQASAASYAYKALSLAEVEDQPVLAAMARVRIAHVLHAAGDPYGALQVLGQVQFPKNTADKTPDTEIGLLHMKHVATRVHSELQQYDLARQWSERAIKLSLRLTPSGRAMLERSEAVNIELSEAEAAEKSGDHETARLCFARGLEKNERLGADVAEIGDAVDQMCWLGNQAVALTGLGRLDEAWVFTQKTKAVLLDLPNKGSPWYEVQANELRLQWAGLLAKSSRLTEALEEIEQGLTLAVQHGRPNQVQRFAELASKACEGAGRFQEALAWMHRARQTQSREKQTRAAALAAVHQASRDHDSLVQELQGTRAKLETAQQHIQSLSDRIQVYESLGITDASGLISRTSFLTVMASRQKEAFARDLPCFVGLLELRHNHHPYGEGHVEGGQHLVAIAARGIQDQLGQKLLPISRWSASSIIFALDGMGQRRAAQTCAELACQVEMLLMSVSKDPGIGVRSCLPFNLAASECIETAWVELGVQLSPPPPSGPAVRRLG